MLKNGLQMPTSRGREGQHGLENSPRVSPANGPFCLPLHAHTHTHTHTQEHRL